MSYSRADVHALKDNAAWKEIVERMQAIAVAADAAMENPEQWKNREATGERRVARTVPNLPDILLKEFKP